MELDFTWPGRMLGASKSDYRHEHPDHVVVFNANVCTRSKGKIWYGDLDLNLDAPALARLAVELGEEIFVLYEYDARFDNEKDPALDQAVARAMPDGRFSIERNT